MDRTNVRYLLSYKYVSFTGLYIRCLLTSLPVLGYSGLVTSILYLFTDASALKIYYLPIGLGLSIFLYPMLFINMRRKALVWIDLYWIVVLVTALGLKQDGFEYVYICCGFGIGCGIAAL